MILANSSRRTLRWPPQPGQASDPGPTLHPRTQRRRPQGTRPHRRVPGARRARPRAQPGRGVEHRVADRGRLGRGCHAGTDGGAGAPGEAAGRVPGGPRRRRPPPAAGPRPVPTRAARDAGLEPRRRHHLPRSQAPPARQHHRSPYRHAGDVGPSWPARCAGGRRGDGLVRPARHLPAAGDRRPRVRGRRRGREPAGAPRGLARLRDRSSRSTSPPPASAGRRTRPKGSRPPTSAGSRS